MTKAEKIGEPSMEDILASIRKIISEEPAQLDTAPTAALPPPPLSSIKPVEAGSNGQSAASASTDAANAFDSIDNVLGLADEDVTSTSAQAAPSRAAVPTASAPSRSVPSWLFPRNGSDGSPKQAGAPPGPLSGAASVAQDSADAQNRPAKPAAHEERPVSAELPPAPKAERASRDLGSFVPGFKRQQRDTTSPTFGARPSKPETEPSLAGPPKPELSHPGSHPGSLPQGLPPTPPKSGTISETSGPFAAPELSGPATSGQAEKPVRTPSSIFDRLAALGVSGGTPRPSSHPDSQHLRSRVAATAAAAHRDDPKLAAADDSETSISRNAVAEKPAPVSTPSARAAARDMVEVPTEPTSIESAAHEGMPEPAAIKPVMTQAPSELAVNTQSNSVVATPGAISTSTGASATSPGAGAAGRTLEDTVAEMLRPMLRQWLDANMPRIVEKALRVELAGTNSNKTGASKT